MHQILALMFLLFGVNVRAQERPLSPKARELTQALAVLRTSPDDSATQERYLKAFPHDYKEFLNLFEQDHELYDGHDFVEALSVAGKDHETDLGKLLVGLAKDAHHDADAPSYLQHSTAAYAARHPKTFAELFKQLPPEKQTQLVTFLADVENHRSYSAYQEIIDGLNGIGEDKLAIRFKEARMKREKQPHD